MFIKIFRNEKLVFIWYKLNNATVKIDRCLLCSLSEFSLKKFFQNEKYPCFAFLFYSFFLFQFTNSKMYKNFKWYFISFSVFPFFWAFLVDMKKTHNCLCMSNLYGERKFIDFWWKWYKKIPVICCVCKFFLFSPFNFFFVILKIALS